MLGCVVHFAPMGAPVFDATSPQPLATVSVTLVVRQPREGGGERVISTTVLDTCSLESAPAVIREHLGHRAAAMLLASLGG